MPPARIALWVASIGAAALLARSLWFAPPPLWFAVAALIGYLALALAGVMLPRLEMFADVMCRGDPESRAVALTFDDGPHPDTTRKILAILARGGHKATFFVLGRKARAYPDVLREIHEAGHELALHGDEHARGYAFKTPAAVARDVERARAAVEQACGARPARFRPPMVFISPRTAAGARRAGVTLVGYSVRGFDGLSGARAERVVERVARGLVGGAIVLLHDAAERDDFAPASIEALPRILRILDERGLAAMTLGELAEAGELAH